MEENGTASAAGYFLGFDGGGTKTECVLAAADGRILARATSGPSNPLRIGYTRAWFSLSEALDLVLCDGPQASESDAAAVFALADAVAAYNLDEAEAQNLPLAPGARRLRLRQRFEAADRRSA